jgi:hypothetical protein
MKTAFRITITFLLAASLLGLLITSAVARGTIIPQSDDYPLRDIVIDDDGNIYVIAIHWATDRPHLKAFTADGEDRKKFRLVLPNFCCEPFPLKLVCSQDGYLYVLLPGKEGFIMGADLQLVRIDKTGRQDREFGDKGVLIFPPGFKLKDFDVSPEGDIWVLNNILELHKFDDTGILRRIRELKNIFPENMMGGRLQHYYGRNLFALKDEKLLLIGNMKVSGDEWSRGEYFSALELDKDGKLINHKELEVPWFPKTPDSPSFFKPLQGKSFIRDDGLYGSVLGFREGIRGEPDIRGLSILDWSMKEEFHFFNLLSLELPKEVFLGYNLNHVFFTRTKDTIKLFYPFDEKRDLLVVDYDDEGKIKSKFKLKAFQ